MSITDVITEAMVEAIRLRLENELIEMRDAGLFVIPAANGLVVRNYDGSPSDIIRIPTRMAVRTTLEAAAPLIAGKVLRALADEMDAREWNHKDDWGVSVIYPNALRKRAENLEVTA